MMVDAHLLNTNQLKAVNWNGGSLLVLAGPGSGKTKVLTHRIARLVEESAGENFRILGLTFATKAAMEMRKRVNDLVPNADNRINIVTYHSFSTSILRQHGHHLGISPSFEILSLKEDRMSVLDEAIAHAGLTHHVNKYDSRRLLPLVTTLTEQNVPIDTAATSSHVRCLDDAQEIGEIYRCYRRLMIKNNALDFGGLVAEALRLLTETAAGKMIKRIYPYVCVDEFQDTNSTQYDLLCNIINPDTRNLFVVADNDQIIYEWNGASQDRVRQLQKHFEMTVLDLPENYRCPPRVVRMANRVITNNPNRDKAESIPCKPEEPDHSVRVVKFDTAEKEADWIASDIATRPIESRRGCAVLARTRSALACVIEALKKHGIDGHLSGRKDKFDNERMAWVHAVVRLANSRQDDRRLHQVCKLFHVLEGVDLAVDTITSSSRYTTGEKDYLREWWQAVLRKELNPITMSFLKHAMPKLIDRLDVEHFVEDCFAWFEQRQNEDPAPDYKYGYMDERCVWNTLAAEAARQTGNGQMTLSALLQQIDLCSKEPTVPPVGSIPCHTIFTSKGMGFDHVYLMRLVEDELPDWRAIRKGNESHAMQEERRIFFVAITRAQKSLTLTYPLTVSDVAKEPSRFLSEASAKSVRGGSV